MTHQFLGHLVVLGILYGLFLQYRAVKIMMRVPARPHPALGPAKAAGRQRGGIKDAGSILGRLAGNAIAQTRNEALVEASAYALIGLWFELIGFGPFHLL